jgi:DNA repair exonuclease SbcCD ATPase subunit
VQVKEAHGQCAILETKERESATELKVVKSELTSAVAREQEQVVALAACRRELEACKSELEACKAQLQTSEEARKVDRTDLEKLKGVAGGGGEGEELSSVKRELEATNSHKSPM